MSDRGCIFGNPWLVNQKRRFDLEFTRLQLVAALTLLIGPAYALAFYYAHPRPPRPMPVSNCKNIATALELYSSNHGGRYPAGNHLKLTATCPDSGSTPTATRWLTAPDGTLFPQYKSETGLKEHL